MRSPLARRLLAYLCSVHRLRHRRTTVRLEPHLLTEAKKRAAESGTTLTAVLERAVRESPARRGTEAIVRPLRLKTYEGGGLRAGVDLDDSTTPLDLMDS